MSSKRVVVVGATADYIEHLRSRYPERALFVTDVTERSKALAPIPLPDEEVVADLTDDRAVLEKLIAHLNRWNMTVAGVACFDCESMMLASVVAQNVAASFPSPDTISRCRNKYVSRKRWYDSQIPCPAFAVIHNSFEAVELLKQKKGPVVLKPLSGSGSELVFKCHNENECFHAFEQIQRCLARHANVRMYQNQNPYPANANPQNSVLVEEYIEGKEYSCDFFVDETDITLIRIAEKTNASELCFGTTLAYCVPGSLPHGLSRDHLKNVLQRATRAVGVGRAVCMADLMINNEGVFLLELSPRPGGDCLPPLIYRSSGIEMLGLALRVAEGSPVTVPTPETWTRLVGVRVFARRAGVVKTIDDTALKKDNRVRECFYKANPGYRIVLPPDDYDSRVLGYIIFEPNTETSWQKQCVDVLNNVRVIIE